MDYAAPGWQPWLAQRNMGALEVVQNEALRIISGNVRKSRLSARRKETESPTYAILSQRNILRSLEKAERLPTDHPRWLALHEKPVPPKNQRKSWRRVSKELGHTHKPEAAYEALPISFGACAPWDAPTNFTVHETVPGIGTKQMMLTQ